MAISPSLTSAEPCNKVTTILVTENRVKAVIYATSMFGLHNLNKPQALIIVNTYIFLRQLGFSS